MSSLLEIQQAIAALEAQRGVLGDAVVDASLGALRKMLAELEAADNAEQRKLVTILFADLVGFTTLADKLDPEDVQAIQQAYFTAVTVPIKENQGVIEKYIGDAIMAVFGLPKAEESDPDRAVLAALSMHSALAQLNRHLEQDLGLRLAHPLQLRIGVNTGVAIVRQTGANDFSVAGDSVNLASRLQSAASSTGVLISQDTYRHVRGAFDLQPLEPITVKGKSDPIQVYQVIAAKKRSFRTRKRGVEGIETRMVGRELELQKLQQCYSTAVGDRERGVITIVADPGLGKSRLLYEFENWVDLRPERVTVLRGRARKEIQNLPYGLLRDMFAFRFGIQDDDSLQEVWRKFEQGLQEFDTPSPDGKSLPSSDSAPSANRNASPASSDPRAENLQMRAHFIGQFLGYDFTASPYLQAIKDEPQRVQERASSYLNDYFHMLSDVRPALILFEDLHWADDASLNLIDRLVQNLENKPALMIATARPALYERRQHWMEGHEYHLRMDLHPLSKGDSRRLVEDVLQKVKDIPEALRELVIANAEGNPFYVEELVKMLIEEGVIVKGYQDWQVLTGRLTEILIPPTLTGVLQARLDGLPEAERVLLQQASVIGRVFWDRALLQLNSGDFPQSNEESIQSKLVDLRDKEMVYQREYSVFADAHELIFKHAMLREVTYASVLKRLRRHYHRRAAEWLVEATTESGRIDEYTALIAEHYSQSGEIMAAAEWLTRAGEHALLQGAIQAGGTFFDRALEMLPESAGDQRWRAMEGRGVALTILGQTEAMLVYLDELMQLALLQKNDSHLAEAYLRKAGYLGYHGDDRQAVPEYQAALQAARRAGNLSIEARVLAIMSISQVHLGERETARSSAEAAVEAALATGETKILAKVYNNAAVTCIELGDLSRAIHYLNLSIEYSQQIGDTPGTGNSLNNLGYEHILLGMYEQAISILERAATLNKSIGARRELAYSDLNLALARLRVNDCDTAISTVQAAIAELTKLGDEFGLAAGYTYQGLALETSGRLDEARANYLKGLEIQGRIGAVAYAMDARCGLARCALARMELEEIQNHIPIVWQYLIEHAAAGMEFPLWAYLTCAQAFQAVGQFEQAKTALGLGNQKLMERAQNISDPALRKSYLENVPEHRQIQARWEKVTQN